MMTAILLCFHVTYNGHEWFVPGPYCQVLVLLLLLLLLFYAYALPYITAILFSPNFGLKHKTRRKIDVVTGVFVQPANALSVFDDTPQPMFTQLLTCCVVCWMFVEYQCLLIHWWNMQTDFFFDFYLFIHWVQAKKWKYRISFFRLHHQLHNTNQTKFPYS